MNQPRKPLSGDKTAESDSNAGLESIINEIQALQEKVSTPAAQMKKPVSLPVEQPHSTSDEPWLEETLAHLKDVSEIIEEEIITEETEEAISAQEAARPDDHHEPQNHHDRRDRHEVESQPHAVETSSGIEGETVHESEAESSILDGGILEMTIKGKMVLRLNQGVPGQYLTIRFDSDSLQISMSDGMEFKIPMKSAPHRRAA